MRLVKALALVGLLTAATSALSMEVFVPSDKDVAELTLAIKGKLKDPFSAKFRNFTEVNGNGLFMRCGEVNAKNGFGAYIGWRYFVLKDSSGSLKLELGGNADFICPVLLENFVSEKEKSS